MEAVVNRETPLAELVGGVAMPTAHFYIRNHFPTPEMDITEGSLARSRALNPAAPEG